MIAFEMINLADSIEINAWCFQRSWMSMSTLQNGIATYYTADNRRPN